jgi:hypothetical protein
MKKSKVKPVQATEIKDKKIAIEAIEQIRKKPTAAALKRFEEEEEDLMRLLKK